MAKIITFITEKGGVGKSSCCFNISWELSKKKKILVIDMDGQRANITYFFGADKGNGMMTMYDVLLKETPIKNVIISINPNLDLIKANNEVSNIPSTAKISRFRNALNEVKNDYDYIFIDVNPTPTWTHALVLSVSDFVLIPMLPDMASLEANKGIAESIIEVRDNMNSNLKVLGIVFNKYDARTNLSKAVTEASKEMAKLLNSKVFDNKIRNAVVLAENIYDHIGITDYAKKSQATIDVIKVCKEFEKEVDLWGKSFV